MQTYWFWALMSSICLEGLGRRYLPNVSSIFWYFLKDVVLLFGYLNFRPQGSVVRVGKYLYRGFGIFWIGGLIFTLIQVANPDQQSIILAVVGLRAYWLWWIAPFVVATVLQSDYHRRRAIYCLVYMAIGISVFAAVQFASPADSAINVYSYVDGQSVDGIAVVTTGRARVASTFAFMSGFADFTVLVPTLLLSLGLETTDKRLRLYSLIATVFTAAALPMSGSRSPVVLGIGVLGITCWRAGLLFTSVGRRVIIGGIIGLFVAVFLFPDAFVGVQDRFADTEETQSRIILAMSVLPPVALMTFDYPMGGEGTGMMQNAAGSLHVFPKWAAELELHRYLVELGPIGFALLWMTKLGLMVACLRAYSILKNAGRRAASGAALSYAAVTFFGSITFDHIWQAFFFIGGGFILAETKSALETTRANELAKSAEIGPPPIALRR